MFKTVLKATMFKAFLNCKTNILVNRRTSLPILHFKWLVSIFDRLFDQLLRFLPSWNSSQTLHEEQIMSWVNEMSTSICIWLLFLRWNTLKLLNIWHFSCVIVSEKAENVISPSTPLPLFSPPYLDRNQPVDDSGFQVCCFGCENTCEWL